jgi:uncharacterized protein YbjT (DUF2867 family)
MTSRNVALVFGATGYTGTAVVNHWAKEGQVFAHVRPESTSLGRHADIFEQPEVHVERVPWEDAAIGELVARTQPTVVYGLLGTTRARAKQDLTPSDRTDPYAAVDERLTLMAVRAVQTFAPEALFVYLSALGVTANTSNRYLLARHRVERYLAQSPLRHVIARPAFITGSDRDEFRLGERALAVVTDGVFDALALTGIGALRTLRDKFSSLTGDELGRALVSLGQSPPTEREVYPDELRRRSRE